jgi:mannose-1-phosphate guanylyltransferase
VNANGLRALDYLVKGGPWALLVVIVLAGLAGDYGLLDSQTRRTAEAITQHVVQSQRQQESLDKIVRVLEEQRLIQAQAALIACFKEAKADADRTECIRKFPIK